MAQQHIADINDADSWALGGSATPAMGSDSNMPAEVEVFSRSGSLALSHSKHEGEWLEVNFAYDGYDRHKPLRRTSLFLRSTSTNVNTVAADEGEVADKDI